MWAPATRIFLNTEQIESVVQVHATTPLCVSLVPEYAIEEVGEQQAPTIPTEGKIIKVTKSIEESVHPQPSTSRKYRATLCQSSEQGVMRRTPCAVSLLYATAAGCAECAPSPAASRAGSSIGAGDVRGVVSKQARKMPET
ncbi:unnamed protein product, partial [Iphiclides podalirius]